MKELVVISGKGGTGKTSIVAAFATLAAGRAVLADCDVDAADLHLVLEPTVLKTEDFSGGSRAKIVTDLCVACGKCMEVCRFAAVSFTGPGNGAVQKTYEIDPISCEGCGVCNWVCPAKAIEFGPAINGQWFISDTRHGPMVHAKLGIAEENSGKLVSTVRQEAKAIAQQKGLELVLIDGSPGIGCPVVASITGADLVLIVTEPTLSGLHDLRRVAAVAKHFGIPGLVCVNKWDLNPEITAQIETQADELGLRMAGLVRYDKAVTLAQVQRQTVVEYQADGCAEDVKKIWAEVRKTLA